MLPTRLVTAAVLLTVFISTLLFASATVFGVLIAGVLIVAAIEWARLFKLSLPASLFYALITTVVLGVTLIQGINTIYIYQLASVFWISMVPFIFLRRTLAERSSGRLFLLLAGALLFIACWHALTEARGFSLFFALSLLLPVWLADSGAYLIGRRFGKHKLAPSISAGKSWEGLLGGYLCVLLLTAAALATRLFEPTFFTVTADRHGSLATLAIIIFLTSAGVVGDLFESLLKRCAHVKDSGALLPGHGGILDRIDALLPVLPLAMLLFKYR
jgi:phosphatidate cytidylyltransferase